jgi:hypothetical protein
MFTSESWWIEDLRVELQRRQGRGGGSLGEGDVSRAQARAADAAVARAETLVRTLLDQMNQMLLGGRGSVWGAPAAWGVHLWELWWEPTRERGPYLVVTLLRDSRGTPYLKVQGQRLALEDARLERRLQRALRAAFLEPRVYAPWAAPEAPGRPLASDSEGARGSFMRARRHGRRNDRDDA